MQTEREPLFPIPPFGSTQDMTQRRQIPLAIVGMACRLPGADDLEQFWQMLVSGRSAVDDLPPERFDAELYFDPRKGQRNKSYTRRGAIVQNQQFDHDACPIAPRLVREADITHLIMCQTAAEAFRHAGMDALDLRVRNTGVYVGHTIGSPLAAEMAYAAGIEDAAACLSDVEAFGQFPGEVQRAVAGELVAKVRETYGRAAGPRRDLAAHMAAGIIAKGFHLEGPFMAVNAACASSLQALALAARALEQGRIDMAVVGGAAVCDSEWLLLFSPAQSMSNTASRPFDAAADGLIVAEGYVALVIKTLARALADGDPIQAVIHGVGVSSDGRGRSLWAPRRQGQAEAIRRAYASPEEMADLQYIEAHSTATQVGDATEIASITDALGGIVPPEGKIPITSVKANIGHTLEAAGLAGIVKTVLCMQRGLIPPAANLRELNPSIDWQAAPVYVPRESVAWPDPREGKPRRAGVNAFGIGGLNVHVVIDSHVPAGESAPSPAVISAPAARDGNEHAVAVIGAGCVFPDAFDVPSFWELLRTGRDARRPAPDERRPRQFLPKDAAGERRSERAALGGYVAGFHYDWQRHRIPPRQIEQADPLQFMVLDAADQALRNAGYDQRPFDRLRTGVIVGTEFTGDFLWQLRLVLRLPHMQRLLREALSSRGIPEEQIAAIESGFADAVHARWPALADESGSFSASGLAVRISKTWDLAGGASAVDSGAASGAAALAGAIDALMAGDCDMMLCAAAQRHMRGATPASDAPLPGPFDREAAGSVPGEGVAVFVLKRLQDAHRDGDVIRAILRSAAAQHDSPEQAMEAAMRQALARSGLTPDRIVAAMTDARADAEQDGATLEALLALAAETPRNEPLRIGALAGQIGHTAGASTGASLLAAILAMQHRTVPGVAGLKHPSVLLERESAHVHCSAHAESFELPAPNAAPISLVLSHDKGLAYAIAVEGVPAEIESSPEGGKPAAADRTARHGSSDDLETALLDAMEDITGFPPEVLDLDTELESDLGLEPPVRLRVLRALFERFGTGEFDETATTGIATLRHVADRLHRQAVPAGTETPRTTAAGPHQPVTNRGETVARRSVLRVVAAPPLDAHAAFAPSGAAAILGDHPAAGAVAHRLQAAGARVYCLSPDHGAEAVLSEMEAWPAVPPVQHLLLMTALDADAARLEDASAWQRRRALGVELPFLVVQKWGQLLERHKSPGPFTLAAATSLGGDLGVTEAVVAPEGGWIAGLLKSVHIELNRRGRPTRTKVCDFSPEDTPETIADTLLSELGGESPEVEIAWGGGVRRLIDTVVEPAESLPQRDLRPGSTWIVTGGARGITAEVAIGLGRRYNLVMHLLGRSPAPSDDAPWRGADTEQLKAIKRRIVRQAIAEGKSPEKLWDRVKHDIEIASNLERMRQLGLRVTYHCCDVSDRNALAATLAEIRRTSAPIEGIIHGAGYARNSRFHTQKYPELAKTIGAKVDGALGLMLLTRDDPVRYFVGFGSISGRFGGNGLSDYAAANAMLARLCAWWRRQRPGCATTCIDWQSWDEVGMAMLPDSTVGTRGVLKMKFIPPAEGVEHLHQELRAGLPWGEILIDDGKFARLLQPVP